MTGWDRAQSVLGVRLDGMGDVLMTTPALRALKESCPGRRLALLTSKAGGRIAGLVPEVDEVITYEAPWMKASAPQADSAGDRAVAARLRGRFDASVVFTVFSQNPLAAVFLTYLADIPLRLAHCREKPYHLLTHWVHDPEPEHGVRHEVRRQLDLVAAVGCRTGNEQLSLRPPPASEESLNRLLESRPLDLEGSIIVHPGASAPSRRYAPEGFAAAADQLAALGYRIVLTGSAGERGITDAVSRRMRAPVVDLSGALSLGQLAALIRRSALLISNNTCPVHIAAAVGTPVVDLYALTNPQHTPWGVRHRVLNHDVPCRFCESSICPEAHHRCLRLVPPSKVVEAACELLFEGRPLVETEVEMHRAATGHGRES